MTLGAFLGSCAVGMFEITEVRKILRFPGPVATVLSRKTSIWIGGFLITLGTVLMMATTSIGGLYAGRLILGLGNGCL